MRNYFVRFLLSGLILLTLLLLSFPHWVAAQDGGTMPGGVDYEWELVVDGLDRPLFVTHAGDGSGRLFILEQTGYITIYQDGELLFDPFLDVSQKIPNTVVRGSYSEQGLLGMAFAPDFAETGVFYINYTAPDWSTRLARYTVSADNPNMADPNSEVILLTFPQPYDNHNAGHLEFGLDGYLYMATGDGGSADDPHDNSQNTTNLYGNLLRLDVSDLSRATYAIPADNPFVDTEGFLPEIWAYGLRNPWRFSFDSETGDLYIGDVGQWLVEEIDFQPAASSGGENYGWRIMEANIPHDLVALPTFKALVAPILVYDHTLGCSVTGGYVYRGSDLPELQGYYFYGDYCIGRVWLAGRDADGNWLSQEFMNTGLQISSFGVDDTHELYMVNYQGAIYKLVHK